MMNSKSKPSKWSYFALLTAFSLSIFFFSCKKENVVVIEEPENDPVEWLTETVYDTTIVIDMETFEETRNIQKKEYQYYADTSIVIDYDTHEEIVSINKTYKENYAFLKETPDSK